MFSSRIFKPFKYYLCRMKVREKSMCSVERCNHISFNLAKVSSLESLTCLLITSQQALRSQTSLTQPLQDSESQPAQQKLSPQLPTPPSLIFLVAFAPQLSQTII